MVQKIQAIRGMNDILPEQSPYWAFIESVGRKIASQYSYREIRLPIVESTQLFHRSIGEVTDIVEKEMYTFEDRNGDSLSLRPEGTAGCVRAGIEHGLLHNQVQRLWYLGAMFRHERPQKGRYRQFHQLGVEAYGMMGPAIDAEMIMLSRRLLQELGLADKVTLQLNSLGTAQTRAAYRAALVDFLTQHYAELDSDSQRRVALNPLRVLDSKNPTTQEILRHAPNMLDSLDDESRRHFDGLIALLEKANIAYTINPALVRGLDYYSMTVFEWVTDSLGTQGTVCAGGRYDALVELLGGKPSPAIGFACGIERLVLMLEKVRRCENHPDLFIVMHGETACTEGMVIAERLRDALPELCIESNLTGGGFKSQFKRADKSGANFVMVIGDDEIKNMRFTLKNLHTADQQYLTFDDLILFFQNGGR